MGCTRSAFSKLYMLDYATFLMHVQYYASGVWFPAKAITVH